MSLAHVKDRVGQKFGRLTVVSLHSVHRHPSGHTAARWNVLCECGTSLHVLARSLVNGHTRSCGCLERETTAARSHKHGHAPRAGASPEFTTWANIIQRCTNRNASNYSFYGGRGITVAPQWMASFEAFLADVGPRPSKAHSIDRIDPDGNYEPSNVRWATAKQQGRNTRRNHLITFRGVTKCASEWAEETGLDSIAIIKRLRRGWTPERALTEPSKPRRRSPSTTPAKPAS